MMHAPPAPLIIGFPMAGDTLGGSHHSLRGLLEGLDRARFRPIIIVERPGGRLAEYFRDFEQLADPAPPRESFEAGRSFSLADFASTLKAVRRRSGLLKEAQVDIVHSNDGRSHASWALAAKVAGAKLLWHHRADPAARGLRYLAPFVADKIVTVSRFSMPQRRITAAARDAEVVFSPFDTEIEADANRMRARLLEELGASDDAVLCGYFGSFIERKRPLGFIDAVARLRALIDRPVHGLMFGEASHKEIEDAMRRKIEREELSATIRMMGYRSPGADWIAGCDFLLVPAIGEPLGRTLVEAMLVGTSVIATRSGGNPEALVDGTGVLVPPEDPAAMARACADLIASPGDRAAITSRARASAIARFSRAQHVDAISHIYRELASHPR